MQFDEGRLLKPTVNYIQAYLGAIADSVPDHGNKANIAIK